MVRKFYLLIGIILLITSCVTKLRYLTMTKTPFWGDELRVDGLVFRTFLQHPYNYLKIKNSFVILGVAKYS